MPHKISCSPIIDMMKLRRIKSKGRYLAIIVISCAIITMVHFVERNLTQNTTILEGQQSEQNDSNWIDHLDFNGLSKHVNLNATFFTKPIVPNIVHFIQFDKSEMSFIWYLCVKSALVNQKPDLLLIHCNFKQPTGKYWNKLMKENRTNIKVQFLERPTQIFGQPLNKKWVEHSSDVARIQTLMKYGGTYLDNDCFVVKPFNHFRHFEMAIYWGPTEIGSQIIIAHKRARFLSLWLDCYKNYKKNNWYGNVGKNPLKVLQPRPDLVHRVYMDFGGIGGHPFLYQENHSESEWRQRFVIVHLNHRRRLTGNGTGHKPPGYYNEYNIGKDKRTFSSMARSVLFGDSHLVE